MNRNNLNSALVLGLGNRLLRDDAAGPLVIERLQQRQAGAAGPARDAMPMDRAVLLDGGTLGLSLLPDIEEADALVAVDAARFGAAPGTVRVFEGEAMDAQLLGRKRSAHEVALADLMGAAALQGRLPLHRALVAVEPESTEPGLEPTPALQAALPQLCREVEALVARWSAA